MNPIAFTVQQLISQNNLTRPTRNNHQQNNYQNNFRGRFRGRRRFHGGRFIERRGRGNNYNSYPNYHQHPRASTYNPPPSNYKHPEYFNPPLLSTPASIGEKVCQISNIAGHTAKTCNNRRNFAYNANLISDDMNSLSLDSSAPSVTSDGSWCLDSGASNHMTPSLGSFSASQPYQSNDTVIVGNWS